MPRSRSLIALLGFLIIIVLLGGYQLLDKNNNANHGTKKDAEIIDQAKATAIKHLKDKYELDVEITEEKILPAYIANEVRLKGNVIGSKDQYFNITVNYKTNETLNFAMSPELVAAIRAKGFEPFIKK